MNTRVPSIAAAIALAVATLGPSAPVALAGQAIATAEAEQPGIRADITQLKRMDGSVLQLRFTLVNESDDDIDLGNLFRYTNLQNLQLIDIPGRKLYRPIRGGGTLLSSDFRTREDRVLSAGESRMLWVRFPAPPPKTTEMTLLMPNFMPADGVPISD